MKITNIHKNYMGTISFNAKFTGARKEQEFVVYPNPSPDKIMIQSDTRCGFIKGDQVTTAKCQYFVSMPVHKQVVDTIENIEELRTAIRKTASPMAGSNGFIYCDNSLAAGV